MATAIDTGCFVDAGFYDFTEHYTRALRATCRDMPLAEAKAALGSPSEYYVRKVYESLAETESQFARAHAEEWLFERNWVLAGRPYYRVFPDYVEVFRRTVLDVPLKYVVSPYESFLIRFQAGHEPTYGGSRICSLRVAIGDAANLLADAGLGTSLRMVAEGERYMSVVYTLALPDGNFTSVAQNLRWREDDELKTVAEFTAENFDLEGDFSCVPSGFTSDAPLVSVVLSVCFLATGGDRLIDPDLLNKDFRPYLEAVNRKAWGEAKAIGDKSHRQRNGRPGFTVGREEAVLGRRDANRADGEVGAEREGHELAYQHQRKGHLHKFWSGPNRDQLVVRWVRQHTVRPDLPLPAAARVGARTLRSKQDEKAILEGDE